MIIWLPPGDMSWIVQIIQIIQIRTAVAALTDLDHQVKSLLFEGALRHTVSPSLPPA